MYHDYLRSRFKVEITAVSGLLPVCMWYRRL